MGHPLEGGWPVVLANLPNTTDHPPSRGGMVPGALTSGPGSPEHHLSHQPSLLPQADSSLQREDQQ
jgi:hypothetical protein